jgi:glycosyltransferase involved in cell wall biosynthesis
MKITWLINNILQIGGVEQVVCGLSNHLVQELGHNVSIVSVNTNKGKPYFNLDSRIEIRHCGLNWKEQTRAKLDQTIASVMQTLDADVLMTCHSNIGICALRHRKHFRGKIVVTLHCSFDSDTWKRRLLNAFFYRFADAFVVLTKRDQQFYRKLGCNPFVIPNAVYGKIGTRATLNDRILLAAGRLTFQKGFDLLIPAFAMVAHKHPDWKLCICGNGEDADRLKTLTSSLGIENQVLFPGFVNVSEYMSKASGYVLSSRSEGFPLVLGEAMAHGLPVVSYAIPPVVEICGEDYPMLAPCEDIAGLAEKIDQLLSSDSLRQEMGNWAYQFSGKLSIPAVVAQWEALFSRLLSAGGK